MYETSGSFLPSDSLLLDARHIDWVGHVLLVDAVLVDEVHHVEDLKVWLVWLVLSASRQGQAYMGYPWGRVRLRLLVALCRQGQAYMGYP